MPPLLSIVGRKHSGKTTTLVRLSALLRQRGLRVMTIKHGSHTFSIDPEATDTWRHYHEGEAERVAMVSPDKFALVMRWSEELDPVTIARTYMAEADLVLCEGFKASAIPRVEVFRRAAHDAPLYDAGHPQAALTRAICCDDPAFQAPCPVIDMTRESWLHELADVVMRETGLRGA